MTWDIVGVSYLEERRSVGNDRHEGIDLTEDRSDKPPGEIERQLLDLHALANECIHRSTAEHASQLGQVLQLDVDIRDWELALARRPETQLLTNARRELGFATYAASCGLYLQAFSSLRLFLELSFACVDFSANELLRRQWWSDRASFSWSRALDSQTGVLGVPFVREFRPDAEGDAPAYSSRAAKCYRECSQFIHGKVVATDALPRSISYAPEVLDNWTRIARGAAESVLFLLYCRYSAEVLEEDDGRLAATLEHSFAHLPAVRKAIGLPVDREQR